MPEPHSQRAEIFLPAPANMPAFLPEPWPLIVRFKSAISFSQLSIVLSPKYRAWFFRRPASILSLTSCHFSLPHTSFLPHPFSRKGLSQFLDNVYPQTLGICNQLNYYAVNSSSFSSPTSPINALVALP